MKGRPSSSKGRTPGLQDALRLLDKLQRGSVVTDEDLLEALGVPAPPCPDPYDKACKFRKDNPNCFCGLVPGPGSSRRKGLWQKELTGLQALGDDPAKGKREVHSRALLPSHATLMLVLALSCDILVG